jgi:hypothetical protein
MDIGKEAEEPVEYPIPTRAPVRREVVPEQEPATAPVEEPVKVGAMLYRTDNVRCASCGELKRYCRCGNG